LRFWTGLIVTLRFAGNDSPSFVFPTAIATRQSPGGSSNRPPPPAKPGFLSSGAGGGGGGHLSQKRGTEDLDFFIGDEAIQANAGSGYGIDYPIKHGIISDWSLMERYCLDLSVLTQILGSQYFQVFTMRTRGHLLSSCISFLRLF
jgi:actin-related protein